MLIHLNGKLLEESKALVPVCDRGLLFGDGIFETMRAVAGAVFRMDRHLQRLRRSASLIGLDLPWSQEWFADAVRELLRANELRDARIRLTVTRGLGRPGDYLSSSGPPTVAIVASPFGGPDGALFDVGVEVAVARRQAIPAAALDPAIKSISRLGSVLARREAHARSAHEAILLDALGNVTEGTASNIFLVDEGRLKTPPVPDGGLPGITRETVIGLAREGEMEATEEVVPVRSMYGAREIFLTNTSWEVLPVTRVEGRPVGDGRPGPVTRGLHARYRKLVRRECGDA